jgi:hypothetical protein
MGVTLPVVSTARDLNGTVSVLSEAVSRTVPDKLSLTTAAAIMKDTRTQ